MTATFTLPLCRLSPGFLLGALLVPLERAHSAVAGSVPAALAQHVAAHLESAPPLAVERFVHDRDLLAQVCHQRASSPIWAGHADRTVSLAPAPAPAERDLILTDRFLA